MEMDSDMGHFGGDSGDLPGNSPDFQGKWIHKWGILEDFSVDSSGGLARFPREIDSEMGHSGEKPGDSPGKNSPDLQEKLIQKLGILEGFLVICWGYPVFQAKWIHKWGMMEKNLEICRGKSPVSQRK